MKDRALRLERAQLATAKKLWPHARKHVQQLPTQEGTLLKHTSVSGRLGKETTSLMGTAKLQG
jgi:hypothetical protein